MMSVGVVVMTSDARLQEEEEEEDAGALSPKKSGRKILHDPKKKRKRRALEGQRCLGERLRVPKFLPLLFSNVSPISALSDAT